MGTLKQQSWIFIIIVIIIIVFFDIKQFLHTGLLSNISFFKVNDRNIKKRCKICSNLTIKMIERHDGCLNIGRSGVDK